MHAYFNQNKPPGSERSQIAIQSRWQTIQKAVNKFYGHKSIVDRRNESGKNEADRIEDAIKMYEKTEPFHFMHCWKVLKDESKWNDKLQDQNLATSARSIDEASHPQVHAQDRPEGRDFAKKKLKKQVESESSTTIEVLQRIYDNREKSQVKKDEQLQQILARKDEKLSLQREILEIKKQTRDEVLMLRKQETELRAKQTESQLMAAEAGIMGIDLDKVAAHLKDYYIGMQKQIMERRGFTLRNNDNA